MQTIININEQQIKLLEQIIACYEDWVKELEVSPEVSARVEELRARNRELTALLGLEAEGVVLDEKRDELRERIKETIPPSDED